MDEYDGNMNRQLPIRFSLSTNRTNFILEIANKLELQGLNVKFFTRILSFCFNFCILPAMSRHSRNFTLCRTIILQERLTTSGSCSREIPGIFIIDVQINSIHGSELRLLIVEMDRRMTFRNEVKRVSGYFSHELM